MADGQRATLWLMLSGIALLAVAGCGGDGSVTASSNGGAVGSTRPPGGDAPVGSGSTPLDQAPRGPGIVGRVTSADGPPVVGALIEVTSLDTPSKAVPEIAVLTNAEGRYHWTLPAGAWSVTASAPGYRPATGRTDVRDRALATLDLVLSRAP